MERETNKSLGVQKNQLETKIWKYWKDLDEAIWKLDKFDDKKKPDLAMGAELEDYVRSLNLEEREEHP